MNIWPLSTLVVAVLLLIISLKNLITHSVESRKTNIKLIVVSIVLILAVLVSEYFTKSLL